ncbi:MAG: pyridoxine 5'-phosphate synthase [Deltaproteobacteria bacterium]|nr:pyridoxine 5'-phosphate synthase [Deltaproteobacteria bacterium]
MEIMINSRQKLIDPTEIREICLRTTKAWDTCEGEVSLLAVEDREIAGYNRRYLGREGPTNVLAFPMQEGLFPKINPHLWGDVVISTETAGREAREAGITPSERFQFLLIHGLLHLIGYDHEVSRSEARRMESKTREIMARIIADKKEESRMQIPRLAVNVDHVATVRQARMINEPDPVIAAGIAELAGAEGIIVHLREDRRHIQDRDLLVLKETVKSKLNLEMAAAEEIIRMALKVRPHLVTLVPEKRQELTTEGGLDVRRQQQALKETIKRLHKGGMAVSLFVDADPEQIRAAKEAGADIIELHTGHYAEAKNEKKAWQLLERIKTGAQLGSQLGLKISAGHGLNYLNIKRFQGLEEIEEYSIGHSIIARALYVGLDQAVREMVALVEQLY